MLATTGLFSGNLLAADLATDVGAASGAPDNSNGGYLEFGFGLDAFGNSEEVKIGTALLLTGAYRYRGIFLEAFTPSIGVNGSRIEVGGITLGVNLWRNDHWSVDLLGASTHSRFRNSRDDDDNVNSPDRERERAVLDRHTFYSGAGLRLTGYFGNTIFRFRLVDDTHGGNGIFGTATVGYSRQLRNWNIHTLLSADYLSQDLGQYWFGVPEEQASIRFPQYEVDSSALSYSAEIGATYPLRENVVFRSVVRTRRLPDVSKESPLGGESRFGVGWSNSVSYVF